RVGGGDGRVGGGDVGVGRRSAGGVRAGAGGGAIDAAVDRVTDGGGPELGQGGQGGVSADPVPGAGLALVPSEHVLAGFERFLNRPAASRDGDEIRHGRGPARRCPAQVERQLVRAGDQPPDQQVLPGGGGGGQRPVA